MNKFYKAIEEKIKASGYPREISGRGVYNDICDQIEDKENGTYLGFWQWEHQRVSSKQILMNK